MLRLVRAMLLLSAVTFVAGCSAKVNKNDLTGRYEAAIESEEQIIQINSDGTYNNEFRRNNALVWRDRNRWSYGHEAALGEDAVTFNQFKFGFNEYENVPGFWPVRPERAWSGAIELCFDPDINGRCFVKHRG